MKLNDLDVQKLRSVMEAQDLGQKELVNRSGVSRAQLSRILSHDRATVRIQTIERLAQALRLQPTELAVGAQWKRYRDWVLAEHGHIDFRGIGMPQLQRQPIDAIFVEPEVVSEERDGRCERGSAPVQPRPFPRSRTFPASELILTRDRVVVLGHPGNGKTTLLRWMARQAVGDGFRQKELPIFVRLAEFSRALDIDLQVDPVKYVVRIAASRGHPDIEGLIRAELANEKRHCLVLLDGLDEVGQEDCRERLLDAIKSFIERYPRNRFVLTSRKVGFDATPWENLGFSVARILGYGPVQLAKCAEKWARILPSIFGRSETEARESLEKAIFSNPRVRALASNPLVLTILALLNESRGGALPRRRIDLYAKVADVFLDTWEKTKRYSETFDETSDIDLDAREFGWLLSDLALAMQKNSRTLASRWWISDRMQDCLQNKLGFTSDQAKDAGDRILGYLTERTGLIEERGLDQFGFSHRTLQEYFAATGALDEADATTRRDVTDCLRGYFYNPQWCEVVRLVTAQLAPPVAESMIRSILDDPDPVGRFLRRGPFMALRCLADGATVPNRSLVSEIFESLADLARSRWLGITLDAFDALSEFRGARLQPQAESTIDAILKNAIRELDADDYDCLYQHVRWLPIIKEAEKILGSSFESEAAREVMVKNGDKSYPIVFFNGTLQIKNPEVWIKSVCTLLQDDAQSPHFKGSLVRELGRQVATYPVARRVLRKLLVSTMPAALRAQCARALRSDSRLLVRMLEREEDVEVRAACASALKSVAHSDPSIRDKLLRILKSDEPAALRAGAALGLGKAAQDDAEITAVLLKLADQSDTAEEIRVDCGWALEDQIGKSVEVTNAFKRWLDIPAGSKLRRVAAQALGNAMAADELPWDHHVVERIEHVLLGLEDPCPHALESLEALVTAREVRRGLRLENVLRDALKPVAHLVQLAFVFGSTARKRHTGDSDIDLMVIGNVKLKDMSTPLRDAEKTLGRRISPAMYTQEAFQQKYQAGDPFLIDVYRHEKIPVIPAASTPERELEDELRAMVTERVASTS